jgi:hypothetical protein
MTPNTKTERTGGSAWFFLFLGSGEGASLTTLPDPIPFALTQLPSKKYPNKEEWLQGKLDSPVKLHLKMTDEDVSIHPFIGCC